MQSVEASIQSLWPLDAWIHAKSVVGVSGGPDSVALLHALWTMSGRKAPLVVAHIDHGRRGEESDGDRAFVQDLAARWNLPCEVIRLTDQYSVSGNVSEDALRQARHRQLRRVAVQHGASWIATGHHADDVVETMLHRLLRGSGPRGLASIVPKRTIRFNLHLVHPLLAVHRFEIMHYLEQNQLAFRTDHTNTSDAYTRNRIRHQLLPYLREFAGTPRLDQRLWQSAQQIREEHAMIEQAAQNWLDHAGISRDSHAVEFPALALDERDWCVIREGLVKIWHDLSWPLQGMTAKHWMHLRRFLMSPKSTQHPRRMQLPGPIEVTMRRGRVRFSGLESCGNSSEFSD
jgi:tRNA(Ile)-lysidine synthase